MPHAMRPGASGSTRRSAPGEIRTRLAREIGVARYGRLREFDRSAGDAMWQKTADFWKLVREYWRTAMAEADTIHLSSKVEGRKLIEPLFARAQAIADGETFSAVQNREFVWSTIDRYRLEHPTLEEGVY